MSSAEARISNPVFTVTPQKLDVEVMMRKADRMGLIDHHVRVMEAIEPKVEQELRRFTPVEKIWQPSKHIISHDSIIKMSNGNLLVHLGHAITEAGIGPFETGINRFKGIGDKTGTDQGTYARVLRWWTGEEDRHKVVYDRMIFRAGMYGRVNLREYEKTNQSFIRNGLNPIDSVDEDDFDPYEFNGFAAWQEGNTVVATAKAGILASNEYCNDIYEMDRDVASDENRHYGLYKMIGKLIIHVDPEGYVIALARETADKKGMVMPAALMTSGETAVSGTTKLFRDLVRAEVSMNGFTPTDYAKVYKELIDYWKIETVPLKTKEAEDARMKLLDLVEFNRRRANIFENMPRPKVIKFPWIDEPVELPTR